MKKVKKDFDKDRRSLSSLPVDTLVVLQNFKTRRWDRKGTIAERKRHRNTYVVEVEGRNFLRNRRFLRPCLQQLEHEGPELHPDDPKVDVVEDQQVSAGTRRTEAEPPETGSPHVGIKAQKPSELRKRKTRQMKSQNSD